MKIIIDYKQRRYYIHGVHPNDDVVSVKTKIREKIGFLIQQQNLYFDHKEMENDKQVKDYSIQS